MLFLAGLMGMALVGATVFISVDGGEESEDAVQPDAPQDTNISGFIASGTLADEVISGSDGADQINGYGGADTIDGGAGYDALHGWTGDDELQGGAGEDTLHGEDGADLLLGEEGADALYGHNGHDTLVGGLGDDMLHGSADDDLLLGEDGDDALHGGLDDDTLVGGAGEDTLLGGWGNDLLDGREDGVAEQDFLNGGGADNLVAGGEDIVTTGMGADNVFIGDWVMPGEEAQVHDFDPMEDRLIIVFDDQANASEPEITIARDGLDPDVSHILMNGEMIAAVHSELSLSMNDLMVMTQSDAALFFGIGETSTAA